MRRPIIQDPIVLFKCYSQGEFCMWTRYHKEQHALGTKRTPQVTKSNIRFPQQDVH